MALKGNQKKLDKNNNNRIDAQDFKILKAEKAKGKKVGGEIKKDPTKPVNPFEKRRKKLMGIKQAVGKAGRLGAVGTAVGAAAVGAKKLIDKIKEKKNKKMELNQC